MRTFVLSDMRTYSDKSNAYRNLHSCEYTKFYLHIRAIQHSFVFVTDIDPINTYLIMFKIILNKRFQPDFKMFEYTIH